MFSCVRHFCAFRTSALICTETSKKILALFWVYFGIYLTLVKVNKRPNFFARAFSARATYNNVFVAEGARKKYVSVCTSFLRIQNFCSHLY